MFFAANLTEEVITKNEFNGKKSDRRNSKDILLNEKPASIGK